MLSNAHPMPLDFHQHRIMKQSSAQEGDVSTPIPPSAISVESVGIVHRFDIEFAFANQIVVAAHDAGERSHEAATPREMSIRDSVITPLRTKNTPKGRIAKHQRSVRTKRCQDSENTQQCHTNSDDIPSGKQPESVNKINK